MYEAEKRTITTRLTPKVSQIGPGPAKFFGYIDTKCRNSCLDDIPSSRKNELYVYASEPGRGQRKTSQFRIRRQDTGNETAIDVPPKYVLFEAPPYSTKIDLGASPGNVQGLLAGEPALELTWTAEGHDLAQASLSLDRYSDAMAKADQQLSTLQTLLRDNKCDRRWLHVWDWRTVSMSDCQRASEACTHLITHELKSPGELAEAHHMRGMFGGEQAIADFGRAIELAPRLTKSYLERARLRFNRAEEDDTARAKAIEDVTKAIEINPDASTFETRAAYYSHMEYRARAREDFTEAERLYHLAIADYTQAIELDGSAKRHVDRAGFYCPHNWYSSLKSGDYRIDQNARAFADITKAIDLEPDAEKYRFRAELSIGRYCARSAPSDTARRDFSSALADYDILVERYPTPEFFLGRGDILRQLRRTREAIADYERVLALEEATERDKRSANRSLEKVRGQQENVTSDSTTAVPSAGTPSQPRFRAEATPLDQVAPSGGWLGINIDSVTEQLALQLKLGKRYGARVLSVNRDGPGDRADIRIDDIILAFNGIETADARQLAREVADQSIGAEVDILLLRNGERRAVKITIGARPADADPQAQRGAEGAPSQDLSLPQATGPSLWTHNGSTMKLVADGASRRFYYVEPRQGMRDQGVTPGTLLFEGEKNGDRYTGTAYIFSKRCGRSAYQVSGDVSPDQRTISLSGQAPRLDAQCKVTGYLDDHLLFEHVPSDPASSNGMPPIASAGINGITVSTDGDSPPTGQVPRSATFRVSSSTPGGMLNMRRGPGTRHPRVVGLPVGAIGIKSGSCQPGDDDTSQKPWCEVEWQGFRGWASSCCLEVE